MTIDHINVPPHVRREMVAVARDLRKDQTPSEALIWRELRSKQLDGIKFRRQQPIGPFIVDFFAPELRLVIEVDGSVHQQQKMADQARQEILESLDLQILRFPASQVEENLDLVIAAIHCRIEQIRSSSSPLRSSKTGQG